MKRNFIVIVGFLGLFLPMAAWGAPPAIFYSDLTSAPNTGGKDGLGAFVTIWGKNFGDEQGDSYVSVGGKPVSAYPIWLDSKITFQLGPSAQTGDILVTTSDGVSSGIPFSVRTGNIYFVDGAAGSGGNGSYAAPWNNPADWYNTMQAGDVVYFRQGTYGPATYGYPGYYALFCLSDKPGTEARPIAWVTYPGESVTFDNGNNYVTFRWRSNSPWHTFSGFKHIGSGSGGSHCGAIENAHTRETGIRAVDLEVSMSCPYSHIAVSGNNNTVFGCDLHDCTASNQFHNIYIADTSLDVDVGWNYIHNNSIGASIQAHEDYNTDFWQGKIHDNTILAKGTARGITIASMAPNSRWEIYNNIIINPDYTWGCIIAYNGNISIFNNVLIAGKESLTYPIFDRLSDASSSMDIKNNVLINTANNPYIKSEFGGVDRYVISHNLYSGSSAITYGTNKISEDPLFISPGSNDYRLQSASPARDAGVDTGIRIDKDGNRRPHNGIFDIGAYEYTGEGSTPPPDTEPEPETPANNAPVLSPIGNRSVFLGHTLSFTVSATDADEDAVTYSSSTLPAGASLDSVSGEFSWTPLGTQVGSHTLTFVATDTPGAIDAETLTVVVFEVDTQPPVVQGRNPAPDEVQVPSDTNIVLHITDNGAGVERSSIGLQVKRESDSSATDVIIGGESQVTTPSTSVSIEGTPADYIIVFDPPSSSSFRFGYEEDITVTVSAADLEGNTLSPVSYSFTTAMMVRGPNKKIGR